MTFPLPPALLAKARSLGVRPEDIEEKFIRGGGHGGQKINKTASSVLLRHLPTGIEVRCQQHREQSANRKTAYRMLLLKIEQKIRGAQSTLAKRAFKVRKQKQRRSRRAKEKILAAKHSRAEIKQSRRSVA